MISTFSSPASGTKTLFVSSSVRRAANVSPAVFDSVSIATGKVNGTRTPSSAH